MTPCAFVALDCAALITERPIQRPGHDPPQNRKVNPRLCRSYPPLLWISGRLAHGALESPTQDEVGL